MAAELRPILLLLFLVCASNGLQKPVGDPLTAIQGLVSRVLGQEYVSQFSYEVLQPDPATGRDVFEIDVDSVLNRPVLRGNNGVALGSALNFYLKYFCNCSVSWGRDGSGDQLNLPQPLPLPKLAQRMVSPVKYRYYQNVCTVSYSMVWWNFSRWEREIDWMALNGLNLILSFTGQELVWQKFYTFLELTDSDIKDFFSGPAFLAWQRLGNIRRWGGPLDDGWIASQASMQKMIMARIREFGMINVLPGFAGHVPATLVKFFPEGNFTHNSGWNGFNSTYTDDYLLEPTDPIFMQIGTIFYQMLIDEFGTDHVYNCDTYNEMNPIHTDLLYLADVNKAIFQTMQAVDSDAIFLMQGWLFHSGFWTNDRIEAFLSGVPNDRMIILDLNSEVSPLWPKTNFFFGKPFVWCLLHNYGGTRAIYGNLTTIGTAPLEALNANGSTMVGVGMTPEAIEQNPVVYDLMGEMSWRAEPVVDIESWVLQYAVRRYGVKFPTNELSMAWMNLLYGAYQHHGGGFLKAQVDRAPDFSMGYDSDISATNITAAWYYLMNEVLSEILDLSVQPLQYDIVDIGRQMLVNLFVDLHAMYDAYYNAYVETMVNTSAQLTLIQSSMFSLFDDLDALLGANTNFLLGHWIADARASVPETSPAEAADNAEFNARNQITMWGPHQEVEDYASKEWSGLVSDYYKQRWTLFTDLVNEAVRNGETFNRDLYEEERFTLESKFSYTIKSYPTVPKGDLFNIATNVMKKYLNPPGSYYVMGDTDAPDSNILPSPTWTQNIAQLQFMCNIIPECVAFNNVGQLKSSVNTTVNIEGVNLFVKQPS